MNKNYSFLDRDTIDSGERMSFGNRDDLIEQEVSREFRMLSSFKVFNNV
mgnify:CR=1 FL=1